MAQLEFDQVISIASRKRRIGAILIDIFLLSFLMVACFFFIAGNNLFGGGSLDDTGEKIFIPVYVFMLLYFAKDCYKGVSFGKWIMGIAVRDQQDSAQVPSLWRLFIRNIPLIIWPVEFLVLITNAENGQKRRLGDRWANTIVVNVQGGSKAARVLSLVVMGFAFAGMMFTVILAGMKNSDAYITAIKSIEADQSVIAETGGITGYGMLPSGSLEFSNGGGRARFEIKVLGKKRNIYVTTYLEKDPGSEWKLMSISK